MDRILIERKLDSLRRCLQRVTERCPASAEALAEDLDAQDIVSLKLTRAVQLCVDLAEHVRTRCLSAAYGRSAAQGPKQPGSAR
jgi:hypothetical protein